TPEPPLSKAKDWLTVTSGGKSYTRETNTMPQWAGSCWYYLRYIDPKNKERFVDPAKEKYWMPVDLYVGGAEHAVLHLLYSRFWHKVLFDLGHVSSPEPFMRLVNQGTILGEIEYTVYETSDGVRVSKYAVHVQGEDDQGSFGYAPLLGAQVRERKVPENEVQPDKGGFRGGYVLRSNSSIHVNARSFKMSKS